jgi:hypothetical protein
VLREQLRHLPATDARTEVIDLAEEQPLKPDEAQARLRQRLHRLVATGQRPGTLVVIGGDTLLALCRAADVSSLQADRSARTGWGRASLVGGPWDGLSCYSRSGAFGASDDLRAMLAELGASRHPD